MPQIQVMLVDDSPLFVGALRAAIDKAPGMAVVATASNGLEALQAVSSARPDVIVCDVQMPKMSGLEFLKALLPKNKIPVVVISSTPGVTLSALAGGAVDFIPKPAANEPKDAFFLRTIATIRTAASANVAAKTAFRKPALPAAALHLLAVPQDMVVAIGASTGGTDAILAVVRNLPPEFPPTVVTQHMPPGFTEMYAQRLNRECKMQVHEAKDGDRAQKGVILLAAGDKHMYLRRDSKGYYVSCRAGERVSGHMPSVDVLFGSVAETAGARSMGVILTGMGADGAEGLLKMRRKGAYTIGQDKQSSVVYGMPMVAYDKGAVAKQLPLDEIEGELINALNRMK